MTCFCSIVCPMPLFLSSLQVVLLLCLGQCVCRVGVVDIILYLPLFRMRLVCVPAEGIEKENVGRYVGAQVPRRSVCWIVIFVN